MTRDELIAALEGAEENDAELFMVAWRVIMGLLPDDEASLSAWRDHGNRFGDLLDAGAFLDAALTLVPDGDHWRWLIDRRPGAARRTDGYRAHVWCGDSPSYESTQSWAPSPALALCIASLRARP